MSPLPIQYDAARLDLSPRVFRSTTVAGSPAAAAETTVCTLTCTGDIAVIAGIVLIGWYSVTAGTNGVSLVTKLRRTDTSGATVATSGAITAVAASLYTQSIVGFDTGPTMPGQVYVMTLTVASASAASTVSAAGLVALVV